MPFESPDVVTGLVGLGLIAKGILDHLAKSRTPIKSQCGFDKEARDDLKKIVTILEIKK